MPVIRVSCPTNALTAEQKSVARPHHTSDKVPLQTFEPLSTVCLACGNAAHVSYHTQRTITTLDFSISFTSGGVSMCLFHMSPLSPTVPTGIAEGAWALPHGEYGLDVIALVGFLRYRWHQSLPEIYRSLHERGLTIGERTVHNLLARYARVGSSSHDRSRTPATAHAEARASHSGSGWAEAGCWS
jgi:hypothetical protein